MITREIFKAAQDVVMAIFEEEPSLIYHFVEPKTNGDNDPPSPTDNAIAESLFSAIGAVSYTHLTLPTICSV